MIEVIIIIEFIALIGMWNAVKAAIDLINTKGFLKTLKGFSILGLIVVVNIWFIFILICIEKHGGIF